MVVLRLRDSEIREVSLTFRVVAMFDQTLFTMAHCRLFLLMEPIVDEPSYRPSNSLYSNATMNVGATLGRIMVILH